MSQIVKAGNQPPGAVCMSLCICIPINSVCSYIYIYLHNHSKYMWVPLFYFGRIESFAGSVSTSSNFRSKIIINNLCPKHLQYELPPNTDRSRP